MAKSATKREADAPAVEAHRRVAMAGPSEYGMDEEAQAAEDAILLSYNDSELAWLMGTNVTRYRRYLEITGQLAEGGVPINVDVPYTSKTGGTLNCTMGNWQGEPSSYSYDWMVDGAPAGDGTNNYAVQPTDVGKGANCVVTATNGEGSTEAPPSNLIIITDPAAVMAAAATPTRAEQRAEHRAEHEPEHNGRRTRHRDKDEDE
jgi:hypothetical protein